MAKIGTTILALGLLTTAPGCGGTGWHPAHPVPAASKLATTREAEETLARFQDRDPGLARFIDEAYAVAVFPTVGKGAITIGGAHGKGEVYEQGRLVGSARVTQLTLGLALGGQAYSELIFFENEAALQRFKSGSLELGAQASAIAVTAGASTDASYDAGVAIFTLPKGGLMYEAAVAGQKFSYTPM